MSSPEAPSSISEKYKNETGGRHMRGCCTKKIPSYSIPYVKRKERSFGHDAGHSSAAFCCCDRKNKGFMSLGYC